MKAPPMLKAGRETSRQSLRLESLEHRWLFAGISISEATAIEGGPSLRFINAIVGSGDDGGLANAHQLAIGAVGGGRCRAEPRCFTCLRNYISIFHRSMRLRAVDGRLPKPIPRHPKFFSISWHSLAARNSAL
jgi:hypothetical protein